ncbi:tail fiber protein [Pseudoalteromonas neustonica]|uniref:Tail fiber protein n=1 Tax=Pseudoalteromonas neustonica TaxID=1840331 RepID=A0ABU9U7S4_9GAMM
MATEPFIGTLTAFGGTFTIKNWGMCWGQMQAISENTALFSLLGSTFGGDARTTFGLPDLRGRSPVGHGAMPGGFNYNLGIKMGSERISLDTSQIPSHIHTADFSPSGGGSDVVGVLQVATNDANTKIPDSSTYLATNSSQAYFKPGLQAASLTSIEGLTVSGGGTSGGTVTIGSTGSSSPINIMNPVLPMNWQIALQGIYPSRS